MAGDFSRGFVRSKCMRFIVIDIAVITTTTTTNTTTITCIELRPHPNHHLPLTLELVHQRAAVAASHWHVPCNRQRE
jgi:hypothetical protein